MTDIVYRIYRKRETGLFTEDTEFPTEFTDRKEANQLRRDLRMSQPNVMRRTEELRRTREV